VIRVLLKQTYVNGLDLLVLIFSFLGVREREENTTVIILREILFERRHKINPTLRRILVVCSLCKQNIEEQRNIKESIHVRRGRDIFNANVYFKCHFLCVRSFRYY